MTFFSSPLRCAHTLRVANGPEDATTGDYYSNLNSLLKLLVNREFGNKEYSYFLAVRHKIAL